MTIEEAIKSLEKRKNKVHPCDVEPFEMALVALRAQQEAGDSASYQQVKKTQYGEGFDGVNEKHGASEQVNCSGWISVKDRLPDKEGSYIVCTKNGSVCTSHFYKDLYDLYIQLQNKKPKSMWSGTVSPHITHWMPLPEPPKEESE